MRDDSAIIVGGMIFIGVLVGIAWLQIGVWQECRAEHSFWYCLNLISR